MKVRRREVLDFGGWQRSQYSVFERPLLNVAGNRARGLSLSHPHQDGPLRGVVDTVGPGEVFVSFHYGHGTESANQHTWYARDPVSFQPQLKSSSVTVRGLSFGQPEPWLLARLAELSGESNEPFAAREFGGTVNKAVDSPITLTSAMIPCSQGGSKVSA